MYKKILLAFAAANALASPSVSHASEYGCTVLLCLAASAADGGWQSVSECVPPVKRMLRDLAFGRGFPSCDMSDGADGSSYVRMSTEPYDPCPDGTQPAPIDVFVIQGVPSGKASDEYVVIGEPAKSELKIDDGDRGIGNRACVGQATGSYSVRHSDYEDLVFTFQKLIWQVPTFGTSIDVYVDNKFYNRVKF